MGRHGWAWRKGNWSPHCAQCPDWLFMKDLRTDKWLDIYTVVSGVQEKNLKTEKQHSHTWASEGSSWQRLLAEKSLSICPSGRISDEHHWRPNYCTSIHRGIPGKSAECLGFCSTQSGTPGPSRTSEAGRQRNSQESLLLMQGELLVLLSF